MAAFNRPEQLTDAFAENLNAKDAAALGELFIEDAEFVNIMGMRMRGRQGIVDGHAWAFNGPLRGRRVRFDQVDALAVTDEVTVLHVHCILSASRTLPPRDCRWRVHAGLRDPAWAAGLGDRRGHQCHGGVPTRALTPKWAARSPSQVIAARRSTGRLRPGGGWKPLGREPLRPRASESLALRTSIRQASHQGK
jgi:uncharacterized protein (TIGR02246 family)